MVKHRCATHKRKAKGKAHLHRMFKTRNRNRDLDQVHNDLLPVNSSKLLSQVVDFDEVGGCQYYCIYCAKHHQNEKALKQHLKGKPHKQRLKRLQKETPYTKEESERAGGLGCYVVPKPANIDLTLMDSNMDV